MPRARPGELSYQVLKLGGARYAVLPEPLLHELCRRGRVTALPAGPTPAAEAELDVDTEGLARRLVLRRRQADLTQAELARRAGVRVETLNRIERGRTTPDFATVRKLVIAMKAAEAAAAARAFGEASERRSDRARS
ncbi:MAG: helix-turn-helix transcriptional regulator [Planctomycetota bacterium]